MSDLTASPVQLAGAPSHTALLGAHARTARSTPSTSCARSTTSASIWSRGRVIAVVGESGSGKSVLARMLARIVTTDVG